MTFDELMELLVNGRANLEDPKSNESALELIQNVLNTGANVLNEIPHERVVGMIALIQTSVTIAAIDNNDFMAALLSEQEHFHSALIYAVQACVGLMTLEEIR